MPPAGVTGAKPSQDLHEDDRVRCGVIDQVSRYPCRQELPESGARGRGADIGRSSNPSASGQFETEQQQVRGPVTPESVLSAGRAINLVTEPAQVARQRLGYQKITLHDKRAHAVPPESAPCRERFLEGVQRLLPQSPSNKVHGEATHGHNRVSTGLQLAATTLQNSGIAPVSEGRTTLKSPNPGDPQRSFPQVDEATPAPAPVRRHTERVERIRLDPVRLLSRDHGLTGSDERPYGRESEALRQARLRRRAIPSAINTERLRLDTRIHHGGLTKRCGPEFADRCAGGASQ